MLLTHHCYSRLLTSPRVVNGWMLVLPVLDVEMNGFSKPQLSTVEV